MPRRALENSNGTTRKGLIGAAVSLPVLLAAGLGWWQTGDPEPPPLVDLEAEALAPVLAHLGPAALSAPAAEAVPATLDRGIRVRRGDTLMGLLVEAGADRQEAHQAISALKKVYSPRKLKPGQTIQVTFNGDAGGEAAERLLALRLKESAEREIRVTRRPAAGDYLAEAVDLPLDRRLAGRAADIDSSLFVAGREADVPPPIMIELIRAFSFDVDFQRDIRPGDHFELLYESYYDVAGNLAKHGEVIYAALVLSGHRRDLYRFTPASGRTDYFDATGQSVRKTLMRTPIDGARITSGYGRRRHPVLGYSKMHRGVDFAAPRGTPIYAAGDGVVEHAGRKGAYGRYLRIRHNSTYKTAYAHLHRFAKGARRGARVRQGQVIGYVGASGRTTGPHLHYEVIVNRRQVNPRTIKLPSGQKLKGADLDAFQSARAGIDRLREGVLPTTLIASITCGDTAAGGEAEAAAEQPGPGKDADC